MEKVVCGRSAATAKEAKAVGNRQRRRSKAVYPLGDPAVRLLLVADPQRVNEVVPVLVDRWQHLSPIWDVIRRSVDAGAKPGSYLLTGSATQANPGTHSGAGRTARIRLRPMSLAVRAIARPSVSLAALLSGTRQAINGRTDVDLRRYVEEIEASGFPAIRKLRGRGRRVQLSGYIDRVIDRDLPELGHTIRDPTQLRRWLAAYAAAISTTTTFQKIRLAATDDEGASLAKTATIPYRDALERLFLLDPVPAWRPGRST